jgi:hypothetical protein
MNFWQIALTEVVWYGAWWIAFGIIAFAATRYLGCAGVLASFALMAVLLYVLDILWIAKDMRQHPENERDMDFVFMFGVLCRIVGFNVILLPMSLLGYFVRERLRRSQSRRRN